MKKPSLALIPSGYKASKVYSILPNNGDGDFTFSRNSGATRVNKDGLIENVGQSLGSELVTNGNFDTDTDWTKQNGSTITGGVATIIANGSITSTGANWSLIQNNIFVAGTTYDITFTVRQTVGSGEFQIGNAYTLLFQGAVTSEFTTYTLKGIAGSWANNPLVVGGITVSDEFELSDISVKEVLTEVNIPRLDYSDGGCPSLLLEPQRTNNISYSERLSDTSWLKYNVGTASTITVTDNYAISPSGEMNASRLQMSLNGGTTSSDRTFIRQTLTSQTDYYFSVYLKSTNGTEQKLNWHFGSDDFLITVTNEWQRFELNRNSNATTFAGIGLRGNLVSTLGIDDSVDILVYGFQAEQGSYQTSYIPTYGSTATRLADQCVNNDLDFIIQDEGSVYWEGTIQGENPVLIQLSPDTGNFLNTIYIEYPAASNQLRMRVYANGVLQSYFATSAQKNTIYKIALGYKENDIVGVVNGSIIGTDDIALIQSGLSNVNIGEFRGFSNELYNGVTVKKALLYDKRLSNEELQELTTI